MFIKTFAKRRRDSARSLAQISLPFKLMHKLTNYVCFVAIESAAKIIYIRNRLQNFSNRCKAGQLSFREAQYNNNSKKKKSARKGETQWGAAELNVCGQSPLKFIVDVFSGSVMAAMVVLAVAVEKYRTSHKYGRVLISVSHGGRGEHHKRKSPHWTWSLSIDFKNYSPTVFMISLWCAARSMQNGVCVCRMLKILFTK